MDADYQKVSQVLTNLNADSPLSGKQSKIGSKHHNQSSKKAFFVVIFHEEVLHQFFWQSCSISSALWWISQPYSARAVRLEQRASVTNHTFDQGSYFNSRSKNLKTWKQRIPSSMTSMMSKSLCRFLGRTSWT